MKSSRYNLFIPGEDGEFVVYNTLSNAIAILDQLAKDSIQGGRIEDVDSDNLKKLKDCNIVVDDRVDERKIFGYHYNAHKFKSQVVRFLVLTTYDCNLACPYCYQGAGIAAKKAMDSTTADNIVMFIQNVVIGRRYTKLILGLYGGEPLLNLDCCYRIYGKLKSWTEKKNVKLDVILTTNATLLTEGVLNRLSPLSSVHVTLDGPKHIHDRKRFLKDGEGTYDKIIHALCLLREKDINTSIRINIAKDSLPALPLLLQDLKEKGFLNCEKIHVYTQLISIPCNVGRHEHDSLCIPKKEINDAEETLWHLGLKWGFDPGFGGVEPCSFVNDWTFAVDPFGIVYKCPLWVGSEQYRVGTIRNRGSIDFDHAYYDQVTYDPCRIPMCRDCIYLPKCGGGCPKDTREQNPTCSSKDCEIIDGIEKSVLLEVKHRMLVRA